jgi:hypothetical protein
MLLGGRTGPDEPSDPRPTGPYPAYWPIMSPFNAVHGTLASAVRAAQVGCSVQLIVPYRAGWLVME